MLPRVILHNAISVDGRIDWFKTDIDLFYELVSGWKEDATLAGSETILKAYKDMQSKEDSASAESFSSQQTDDSLPLLVVPDSQGRVKNWRIILKDSYWRAVVILCTRSTPQEYIDYLNSEHIEYIMCGEENIDYKVALEQLNARFGTQLVRVESGGTLNGILLRAGLVDEISVLIHPFLVGGLSPQYIYRAPDLTSEDGVIQLKMINIQKLKDDILWVMYEVVKQVQ